MKFYTRMLINLALTFVGATRGHFGGGLVGVLGS